VRNFVVDASVAIKWLVDEPDAEIASLLLDHELSAPDLLCAECANILWKKLVRGELDADEAGTMASALEAADITLHSARPHLRSALVLASELGQPAYDCVYLSLARQLEQPLVTADVRLIDVVRRRRSPDLDGLIVSLAELPAVL
jgi:predicted nucleic acid-binding protein